MVSQINFGNISTIGGKTVASGSQSGIDTAGLINSLVEARRLPAVKLESKVDLNTSKISALSTMRSKSQAVMDAANALRNPPGFLNIGDNIFESRTPFLTTSTGVVASNYVGISIENGAALSSYDIQIEKLAAANKKTTAAAYAFSSKTASIVEAAGGSTVGKLSAGNFTIATGSGTAHVTVSEGQSLLDVVSEINAHKATTKVEASILQVSSTDFRLILSSTVTGLDSEILITDTDSVFPAATATFFDPSLEVAAQDAKLKFNGIDIERSSNKINDIVSGVTLSLFQTTGVGVSDPVINLEVDKNSEAIATALDTFITAYNDFRSFYAEQNARDEDGNYLETSVLHDSSLLKNTASALFNSINSLVNTGNSEIKSLSDLGVTFFDQSADDDEGTPTVTGMLELNIGKFATLLESSFEDVKNVFGFNLQANNDDIGIYSTSNNLGNIASFDVTVETTVSLDVTQGTDSELTLDSYTSALGDIGSFNIAVDADTFVVTVSNALDSDGDEISGAFFMNYVDNGGIITLEGQVGTRLEGVVFNYTGPLTGTNNYSASLSKETTVNVTNALDKQGNAVANFEMEYVDSNGSGVLVGKDGTVLQDLELIYTGPSIGSNTYSLSLSQGIADLAYNQLYATAEQRVYRSNDVIDADDPNALKSLIDLEVVNLQEATDTLELDISRIDAQIVTYREVLLERFSALEAAIASANSVLQLLDAQTNAANNASG